MNKVKAGTAVLMATGLSACSTSVSVHRYVAGEKVVQLDAHTRLTVVVEGVETRPEPADSLQVPTPKEGEPIHRTLVGGDGKLLFAYDLAVSKSATDGTYHFVLKPAGKGPTFDSSREVAVRPNAVRPNDDAVRVELMEQPDSGRKIVDVFRLVPFESGSDPHEISFGTHLMQIHNRFFKWVQGL